MNKIIKNTLILAAITVVSGLVLGAAYEVTKGPIAQTQAKQKQEACQAVYPEGYVITVTDKDGYGGDIQITVGIMSDGTVNGISFLSISETAGLGMRAKEPSFYNQFAGQQAEKFYVSKDGGDGQPIDALSGATITSRAVTGAVNTALGYYQTALGGSGNE